MVDAFKILKMYRNSEAPDLTEFKIDEIPIVTMTKEEMVTIGKKHDIDLVEVSEAGGIEGTENLCRLLILRLK